jgi:hypothetical protein
MVAKEVLLTCKGYMDSFKPRESHTVFPSDAIGLQGRKPVYKLKDITNISYDAHEKALVDKYLDPYMGKVYEPDTFVRRFGIDASPEASEVLTMSVEQFANVDNMQKLLSEHPDIFELVVGMSRAKGL